VRRIAIEATCIGEGALSPPGEETLVELALDDLEPLLLRDRKPDADAGLLEQRRPFRCQPRRATVELALTFP
jgi:hypothetical protein